MARIPPHAERPARRTQAPAHVGFRRGAAPTFETSGPSPETVATAIRIGNPASLAGAVAARDESGGVIESVNEPTSYNTHGMVVRWRRFGARIGGRRRGVRVCARSGASAGRSRGLCIRHGLRTDAVHREGP